MKTRVLTGMVIFSSFVNCGIILDNSELKFNLYDENITTTQQMADQKKISRKDIMEYAKVEKQINYFYIHNLI